MKRCAARGAVLASSDGRVRTKPARCNHFHREVHMKTTLAMLAACAALTIPAITCGQVAADDPAGSAVAPKIDFVSVDKNADGRLARDETLSIRDLNAQFPKLDADGDGHLSQTEFLRWHRAGKTAGEKPLDPATVPRGSAGSQHMPEE